MSNQQEEYVPAYLRTHRLGKTSYAPSILRDLGCGLGQLTATLRPPFTATRMLDVFVMLGVMPLALAYVGFRSVFWAAQEKFLRREERCAAVGVRVTPSWHRPAVYALAGCCGVILFVVGMVPYLLLAKLTS